MEQKDKSDFQRISKIDFKVEHYISLWQHYENSGGSDKNRMVTVVTWLLAFAAAILGFTATKFDFSAMVFPKKELAIVGAAIGLSICLLSAYLVVAFAGYADRNYRRADLIKRKFSDLSRIADGVSPGRRGLIFKRLGVLFDVFLFCSLVGALLFLVLICLAQRSSPVLLF